MGRGPGGHRNGESAAKDLNPGDSTHKGFGPRRRAREVALQALYQSEFRGASPSDLLAERKAEPYSEGADWTYALDLVEGVRRHQEEIDRLIGAASTKWRIERLHTVDRNVLRLGVYELRYAPDVPPKVAINEAIELAKKYGAEESARFVNGILDRVLSEVTQPCASS
ncbi:MAG: transcription antitermination factor NusB [Nitrospirae bacterium]|nr:transcription antitermination factor NusB [Nitrospirota bacterium]